MDVSAHDGASSAEGSHASAFATPDTVIIKAGEEAKTYNLHKRLLTFHSGFFRGALSGSFKESTDGVVVLNAVSTEVFDIWVDWVYEKTLPFQIQLSTPSPIT